MLSSLGLFSLLMPFTQCSLLLVCFSAGCFFLHRDLENSRDSIHHVSSVTNIHSDGICQMHRTKLTRARDSDMFYYGRETEGKGGKEKGGNEPEKEE